MEEKEQQEFISWLSDQLQATDQKDFESKLQQLGEDGIKDAHIKFKQAKVKQYMSGGSLEKIKELNEFKRKVTLNQTGGKIQPTYTSPLGQTVTDKDLLAYKKQGLDFGTKESMGQWLDSWGNNTAPEQALVAPPTQTRTIQRFNQNLMAPEKVSINTIMREPNSVTVGSAGGISNWDLGQFKKHVTPADTVGQPAVIRQTIQEAWNKLKLNK